MTSLATGTSSVQEYDNNVYYTVNLRNSSQATIQPASFAETRTIPLVAGDVDSYEMCVDRFCVPSSLAPLFIFSEAILPPGGARSPATGYWIAIESTLGGQVIPLTRVFVPYPVGDEPDLTETSAAPYPKAIMNVTTFLGSVNVAFGQLYVAANIIGVNSPLAPFITFDPANGGLLTLNVPDIPSGGPGGAGPRIQYERAGSPAARIYFNTALQSLLNFPARFHRDLPPTSMPNLDGLDYSLLFNSTRLAPANTLYDPITQTVLAVDTLQLQQEAQNAYRFVQFKRILFVSTGIPVRSEAVGGTIGGGNQLSGSTAQKILTDFQISPDGLLLHSDIFYTPTQRRWISLDKADAIRQIDITVYFQGSNPDDLVPALLLPGESMDMKLCFRPRARYVKPAIASSDPATFGGRDLRMIPVPKSTFQQTYELGPISSREYSRQDIMRMRGEAQEDLQARALGKTKRR